MSFRNFAHKFNKYFWFDKTVLCFNNVIMLSKQAIEEYQKIMKEEFGQDITIAEAEEQGTQLVKFFEILIEIDKRQDNK